jgi:hypothetical protein
MMLARPRLLGYNHAAMDTPAESPQETPTVPATLWRRREQRAAGYILYGVRMALAAACVGAWILTGWPAAWLAWQAARQTPSAAGVSYDAQRATLPEGPLYTLLAAARTACPPTQAVLALSDDPIALQQGNYVLYPRRIVLVRGSDPFGPATLVGHAGGCLFFYGPQGGRLDPVRARLTELACSRDGCLYRVTGDQ